MRVIKAGDATRTIYGAELDAPSAGILRAQVVRADGRHTETLRLGIKADEPPKGPSDWRVCD